MTVTAPAESNPSATDPVGVNSPPATQEAVSRVFEYAWHRCNAFDERSGTLKKRYRRVRESIILITWFTTLLAVLAAIQSFQNVISLLLFGLPVMLLGYAIITLPWDRVRTGHPLEIIRLFISNLISRRFQFFVLVALFAISIVLTLALESMNEAPGLVARRDLIFKLSLIILPLLSTGMLAFASRFETGIAWVGFRLVSEAIRRKIYELRIKAALTPLTEADLEDLRTHVLNQRSKLDEMGINTPLWGDNYQPCDTLVPPAYTDDPHDDGYTPLSANEYVNWRLVHQANYYRRRIQGDYGKARSYRGFILFIGALGAFLAAADYGEFVAVTVAGVTALQAWLSLREHEASYGIHVRTLLQLEDRIASYYINLKKIADKAHKTQAECETICSYVGSVEDILDEERRMWKNSVLQGQEATESSLAQLVSSTATDWQLDEAKKEEEQPLYGEGRPVYALAPNGSHIPGEDGTGEAAAEPAPAGEDTAAEAAPVEPDSEGVG
jgi:hypothetical protein